MSYVVSTVPEFERSDPHRFEHLRFFLLFSGGSIVGGLLLGVYFL